MSFCGASVFSLRPTQIGFRRDRREAVFAFVYLTGVAYALSRPKPPEYEVRNRSQSGLYLT